MHIEDYDFELPRGQIAQAPLAQRDASRLMVIGRASGAPRHCVFRELGSVLRPGDLVVQNDSRVIRARLLGRRVATGGRAELLLVRPAADLAMQDALSSSASRVAWRCLGQASKGLKLGLQLEFRGDVLRAEVVEVLGGGEVIVRFSSSRSATLGELLEELGTIPLPLYIEREPGAEDVERYQTVYARRVGSVAAPTAGLHFTPELLEALAQQGIRRATVTLDVGPGTFMPVRDGDIERHRMHSERYSVPRETVREISETRRRGGRVVAVGTTVVRTLESAFDAASGQVQAGDGETAVFIRPGHTFRAVDALLTNFHVPRSSLLMLVSAFLGRERTLSAYAEAISAGYRFFSYGDAMLIGDWQS